MNMSRPTLPDSDLLARTRIADYIASEAGLSMLHAFHQKLSITEKSSHDFVSELDKTIEQFALKTIRESFPNDNFFGEEGGLDAASGEFEWVVDPIDGTNNFLRGLPFAGFQLAIIRSGEIQYGLISRPFTQDQYTAMLGQGAFYENKMTGERRQIHVSTRNLTNAICVFDARIGQENNQSNAIFSRLINTIDAVRVFGAAVYDLPAVAEGAVDVLVSGISKKYDVAAGWLLVEEAGGSVYSLEQTPKVSDELLIFSSKNIESQVLEAIRSNT